uniref:Uncharacterized protein n=1 Tax=Oryza glumipatula TaxID=40148 RepID=A0A0E0A2B3_9ORYZ
MSARVLHLKVIKDYDLVTKPCTLPGGLGRVQVGQRHLLQTEEEEQPPPATSPARHLRHAGAATYVAADVVTPAPAERAPTTSPARHRRHPRCSTAATPPPPPPTTTTTHPYSRQKVDKAHRRGSDTVATLKERVCNKQQQTLPKVAKAMAANATLWRLPNALVPVLSP